MVNESYSTRSSKRMITYERCDDFSSWFSKAFANSRFFFPFFNHSCNLHVAFKSKVSKGKKTSNVLEIRIVRLLQWRRSSNAFKRIQRFWLFEAFTSRKIAFDRFHFPFVHTPMFHHIVIDTKSFLKWWNYVFCVQSHD